MSSYLRQGLLVTCPAGHPLLRASVVRHGIRWQAMQYAHGRLRVTGTISEVGTVQVSCRCDDGAFITDLAKVNAEARARGRSAIEVSLVQT